jgi:hypothetical protein
VGTVTWLDFWWERLVPSLWQQTRFLESNLEKDLANNHLIANYRALAWMGLLFPDWPQADRWRKVGLYGIWAEMRRQVLRDGVHDERSVSYHAIVLRDLLETRHLCLKIGQTVPDDAEPTLARMFRFLADVQLPGGGFPMVNDSVPGYPMDPQSLLLAGGMLLGYPEWISAGRNADPAYATWLTGRSRDRAALEETRHARSGMAVYPEAGYVVFREDPDRYLCFDAGPMGPDHLPGHGHADALSFILCQGGRPLIIDPGVFSYHDKPWRDHFRSTSAHNTVTLDGEDQCVFWGPFRAAYPPRVRLLDWSEKHVAGEHEGYCRLRDPVIHRRRIEKRGPDEWEILDRFEGQGHHDFALTLQFSSGAHAKVEAEAGGTIQWPAGPKLAVVPVLVPSGSRARIEKGWVSPGWNLKEEAIRYVLRWRGSVPVESRLVLRMET